MPLISRNIVQCSLAMLLWACLSNMYFVQGAMDWIEVSTDGVGFVLRGSGEAVRLWGFNYDHDRDGRLIEDYWENEWERVEEDLGEIKQLGGNVVRIHLQTAKFLNSPTEMNRASMERLAKLVALAENLELWIDLTGLGCYHKSDVPAWYDALDEKDRWDAQAFFWESIAKQLNSSPAIFCYDLMNEPVVPGGKRNNGDWLGPPFAGKHFVQFITLDAKERKRPEIAKLWIEHLTEAIRRVDQRHLITVGMVDWSLDRPGLTSGFVPELVASQLDFVSVHLYPESGKLEKYGEALKGFQIGKPVVVEEIFPLKCSHKELEQFMQQYDGQVAGWISFYWGTTPDELLQSKTIGDAILREWLLRKPFGGTE
jgi:Cellulase (glycosyl hydrolase family 5)